MGDRRPLASFTSGDFDFPPASDDALNVTARLDRLRGELQRTREQARASSDVAATERHARWAHPSRFRRRRPRDSAGIHTPPLDSMQSFFHIEQSPELDEGRQRGAKRRKTYHQEPPADTPAYRYGHFGEVEPGRLNLVLESCDGNIHDDRGKVYYGPENLLKHDKSVYCTRTSRCNIVLRHYDSSPFTLEKLYVLAPENGFTAPLKEGLVYVAMSQDDLLPHLHSTNQQANYLNPPRSPPRQERADTRLTLLESLDDPDISRALMNRSREWSPFDSSAEQNDESPEHDDTHEPWELRRDGTWPTMGRSHVHQRPARPLSDLAGCDEQPHPALNEDAQVVVLTDDEVDWPEEPTEEAVLIDRERRERNMAVEDDDNYGWDSRFRAVHTRLRRGRRQAQQRKAQEDMAPSPHFEQARSDGVTRARFRISDDKNKVAIKFDPPVSGTHILLKLQTPYVGKNIDIQTVIASGFAGPRFFPAVQLK